MMQRSEQWSKVGAPVVFGLALTLVIASCGKNASPTAPGASNGSLVQGELTPVPNPPDPEPTPTPTPGGEGCTPGYWKQEQHFDSWVTYSPDQLFSSVFDNAFPGMTLLEVLEQGGGGLNALGRHTVAALLNAANDDVAYELSVASVISAFNAAFPGGDYEALKNEFASLNERLCPID